MMRRWFPWVLLVVVLAGALAIGGTGGGERTDEQRARDIAASVRCPTCRSQSVLESDTASAQAVRAEIDRRVAAGESDDQVRAYLASRYGGDIVLTPPAEGLAGLVWALPVAAVILAFGGLALAFRRWGERTTVEVTDADRLLVERARRSGEGGP
jgi:cytochrome c-type biogenesis protein CcmH